MTLGRGTPTEWCPDHTSDFKPQPGKRGTVQRDATPVSPSGNEAGASTRPGSQPRLGSGGTQLTRTLTWAVFAVGAVAGALNTVGIAASVLGRSDYYPLGARDRRFVAFWGLSQTLTLSLVVLGYLQWHTFGLPAEARLVGLLLFVVGMAVATAAGRDRRSRKPGRRDAATGNAFRRRPEHRVVAGRTPEGRPVPGRRYGVRRAGKIRGGRRRRGRRSGRVRPGGPAVDSRRKPLRRPAPG